MGPPSYMRSVVDRNVVMWCMTIESVITELIEKKIIIWVSVCVTVVGVKTWWEFPIVGEKLADLNCRN